MIDQLIEKLTDLITDLAKAAAARLAVFAVILSLIHI